MKDFMDFVTLRAERIFEEEGLRVVESTPELSLLADIGGVGCTHPFFNQYIKMLGILVAMVRERKSTKEIIKRMRDSAPGSNPFERFRRMYQCLLLLEEVHLIERTGREGYIYEVYRPSPLLEELAASVEAESVDYGIPQRIAQCVSGYVFLRGISITIDWLDRGAPDRDKGDVRGIMRLYPINRDGTVNVPRKFISPIMFLLGYLARGHEEFGEEDLRAWLTERGIKGRAVEEVISWLQRIGPDVHRLVNFQCDREGIHFTINATYLRIRDRWREYSRRR